MRSACFVLRVKQIGKQNGEVIVRKAMKKALPAEMIQIPLNKDSLTGRQEIEVSVVC